MAFSASRRLNFKEIFFEVQRRLSCEVASESSCVSKTDLCVLQSDSSKGTRVRDLQAYSEAQAASGLSHSCAEPSSENSDSDSDKLGGAQRGDFRAGAIQRSKLGKRYF